ncbi:hypothetical protein IFM47457_00813 [Aspergillus lentulus]|nr:hypothetical protein IFM47457_00813 [Aspergillus lentulus]
MDFVTIGAERDEIEQRDLHSYTLPCLTVMLDFEYPGSVIGDLDFGSSCGLLPSFGKVTLTRYGGLIN